tara:strand:+ start:148 stop:675 length:528 start_codon:yes stop_codon:yes gene_type:complete
MNDVYKELKGNRMKAWVIVISDQDDDPPDAEFCKAYRDAQNIDIPILYDPTGATTVYGYNETTVVSNDEGRIVEVLRSTSENTLPLFVWEDDLVSYLREVILNELAVGPGECSAFTVCADGESCLETPDGKAQVCASPCVPDTDEGCPEDHLCWASVDAPEEGFCFDAAYVPITP